MQGLVNFRLVLPWILIGLVIIPILYYIFLQKKKTNYGAVQVGYMQNSLRRNWKNSLMRVLPWLQYISFALLIFALARPQRIWKEEKIKANSIDIFLAMDLSSSMLAQDFSPDRLSVSKVVAKRFVDKRKYDRLGLAVFAGESYTKCPLTTDHEVLKNFLNELKVGRIEEGTAIGMGLTAAVNRLKNSTSKSKIIILLTDGMNNSGYIDPLTAAQVAKEYNIKVYAVGVGTMGEALSPLSKRADGQYVFAMSRVEIDEALMTQLSEMTGGKYYRATDEAALQKIYDEIDKLEKTEVEVTRFNRYTEMFHLFVLAAIVLLVLHFMIKNFVLKNILQ